VRAERGNLALGPSPRENRGTMRAERILGLAPRGSGILSGLVAAGIGPIEFIAPPSPRAAVRTRTSTAARSGGNRWATDERSRALARAFFGRRQEVLFVEADGALPLLVLVLVAPRDFHALAGPALEVPPPDRGLDAAVAGLVFRGAGDLLFLSLFGLWRWGCLSLAAHTYALFHTTDSIGGHGFREVRGVGVEVARHLRQATQKEGAGAWSVAPPALGRVRTRPRRAVRPASTAPGRAGRSRPPT
jgi:hypothetical protein